MKKSLLSAAILAACCSNVALAVTDENESEVRQALEAQGLPTSELPSEAQLLGEMRDRDTSGIFFGAVSSIDNTIATVITSESPLPGDPAAALADMPNRAPAALAKLTDEQDPQAAIDVLQNGSTPPPTSSGPAAEAGTVAVTVSGNVQQDLSCAIVSSDTEFDFGDIDLADASVTSGAVGFNVTCSNETTVTTIYLTTGDTDPAVAGQGSNALVAEFNDGVNAANDVNLAVLLDSNADGAGDVAIGSNTGDVTSAGDQTATAITLVATLDTTQITSGSGGSLTQKGNPEIAVWVN